MIIDQSDDTYYVDEECCCKLTIIVEEEDLRPFVGTTPGHIGIGVENEFFDLGGAGGQKKNVPAVPWWMSSRPTVDKAVRGLSRTSSGEYVTIFELWAQLDECARIKQWWEEKFKDPGNYHFITNSCVTSVGDSLKAGGVATYQSMPNMLYPTDILKFLLSRAVNTCGPNKGRPPELKFQNFGKSPYVPSFQTSGYGK